MKLHPIPPKPFASFAEFLLTKSVDGRLPCLSCKGTKLAPEGHRCGFCRGTGRTHRSDYRPEYHRIMYDWNLEKIHAQGIREAQIRGLRKLTRIEAKALGWNIVEVFNQGGRPAIRS